MAADHIGVSRDRSLNLWVVEMNDRTIVLEEVDFLNSRDVVDSESLQRILQALVVCCRRFVNGLLLPAD